MKKLSLITILSLLLSFTFSTTVFATEQLQNQTAKQKFYTALSDSISNTEDAPEYNFSGTLKNEDGTSYDVAIFKYEPETYTIGNTHVETYVYSLQNAYLRSSDESLNRTKWDDSYSVYGSLTVVFDRRAGNPSDEYLLTRVYGSWTKTDSRVSIVDREVIYACLEDPLSSQWVSKNPTSNTFDYNTGFTEWANESLAGNAVGATSFITLKHGQESNWVLTISAPVFGNDIL